MDAHRKIELQSSSDLLFLTSQIRTAARQKLDLHLPPVSDNANEPDELRAQVETLVDSFVAQVLQGLRGNISINGMDIIERGRSGEDGEESGTAMEGVLADDGTAVSAVEQEDFEPFDDKLRTKLSSTVARRDALIAKISSHRRTTPAGAAAAFQAQFERESEVLLQSQSAQMVGEEHVASVLALQRADEMQRNWERAVEGLSRLNKGLPETRARLERCGDVVGYLGGEKK